MRTTTRSIAAATMVLIFAMAPLASAQTVTITAPASIDGIQPGLAGEEMNVKFTYRFDNAGQPLSSQEQTTAEITVTKSCTNDQIFITGPGLVLVTLAPSATSGEETVPYAIGATRDAPGLTQVSCRFTAQAGAIGTASGNAVPASEPVDHDFTAVADFYGAMQVQLATAIARSAPQKEIQFPLEFTNFGNAPTRVKFAIANEADRPVGERWQHVLPTDVIIGAIAKGQENTGNAVFTVSTPYKTGWNNEIGSYLLTMTTEALDDPEQTGNTMTASILIRVRGVYVPGFEAVALLGGLLGAVVMVRRRE